MSAPGLVQDGTRSGRPLPSQAGTAAALRSVPGQQRSLGEGRFSASLKDGRTRVGTLFQSGCAKLRIPAPHGSPALEAVMINTSGGMTGGDSLAWRFEAGAGAEVTVTTQACEKIYKSTGGTAQTNVVLEAGEGARLWWLPQETILFHDCDYTRTIDADVAEGAEAVFVESFIFGRSAMGERLRSGRLRDRWRLRSAGRLVHAEDLVLAGDIEARLAAGATANGCAALATIVILSTGAEAKVDGLRKIIGSHGGVSALEDKLVGRLVAKDGYALRRCLTGAVAFLRGGNDVPRVWQT